MTRALLALVAAPLAILSGQGAEAGTPAIAIRGGTIHSLAGPDVPNGTIVIRDGKIVAAGAGIAVPEGAKVIDATGLHVYPGFFDAVSRLGLTEVDAVDVTNDMAELGEFNPHLLAATAVHPASEHIPVARAGGITHAVAAPQARAAGIGGQASLIHLDGWTIEEMQIAPSVGFILNWPRLGGGGGGFGGGGFGGGAPRPFREVRRTYEDQVRRLEGWLDAARRYDASVKAGETVPRDLKLEALARVTRGELPLLVSADLERDIRNAVEFATSRGLKIVILGGSQAHRLGTFLAEKQVPVILGPSQATPTTEDAGYDERYAAAGLLHKAGVRFAIATFNSADSRTLPFEAGSTVSFGLPREEALKAITLYPAQILGVADRLGTIEAGKLANLIITDGDPLEIRTLVKHVIIAGRETSLENRHQALYDRYRARPGR